MSSPRAALAMGLVSAVALAFEVALARICSVLLQYHSSFAVVSMAVLGVGLGGFLAFGLAARRPAHREALPGAALLALGPAILLALAVLLGLPFARAWPILLFGVLPVFAAAGAFQASLLRAGVERAGRLYAADLVGGAAGALLSVVALGPLGGPVRLALVVALGAAALGLWWTGGRGRSGRTAAVALLLVFAAVIAEAMAGFLDVSYARTPDKLLARMLRPTAQGTPRLVPGLERWDATSRVDVLELDSPRGTQRLVFIDGETPTPMLQADPVAPNAAGVGERAALAALAFRLRAPEHVLSIGSGGGYDVVLARAFGARSVDAVELNGGVLAVVEAARSFTGDVYRQPGVRVHHGEGRLFVRRSPPGTYDLILLALAQSLAGNLQEYALSENYLYTREAFGDYLRVLRPGGTLAFLVSNPVVQEKLLGTAIAVLDGRGVPGSECVAALASPKEVPYDHLVLVRMQPISLAEREQLEHEVASHAYRVVHAPGSPVAATAGAVRMQPATDERPFFFHLEPGTPAGLRLLLGIASALLVAAGATVGLAARRSGAADARGALTAGAYFAALGLAFLMVEVLVLQRTIRLIGFPALNLGLVLATFLVAAGLGSLASDRLRTRGALGTVLLLLAAALAGLMPLLDAVHAPLERLPLALRSLALVAVLFPFAFAMGMPFPAGLRRLPREWRALVPYFWGVNGVASIAGSALVVAVVLESGFRQAAMLPAALYLVAAGLRRPFVDSGPALSPATGTSPGIAPPPRRG